MHAIPNAAAQGHEHVLLVSDELEEVAPSSIDEELVQVTSEGRLELRIFNGAYVSVQRNPPRARGTDYWLNLAFLDPAPVRFYDRVWMFIAGAAAFTALAAALSAKGAFDAPAGTTLFLLAPVALCVAAGSLGIGVYRYWNRLFFLTRHGRVPVLKLAAHMPDRKEAGRFVDRMAAAAEAAHVRRAHVRSHYLRDEMKEHRRLHESGVLDEKNYETAKTRVLAAHG
jgi:hypothetical protein